MCYTIFNLHFKYRQFYQHENFTINLREGFTLGAENSGISKKIEVLITNVTIECLHL